MLMLKGLRHVERAPTAQGFMLRRKRYTALLRSSQAPSCTASNRGDSRPWITLYVVAESLEIAAWAASPRDATHLHVPQRKAGLRAALRLAK
jgi:hypothetical protein